MENRQKQNLWREKIQKKLKWSKWNTFVLGKKIFFRKNSFPKNFHRRSPKRCISFTFGAVLRPMTFKFGPLKKNLYIQSFWNFACEQSIICWCKVRQLQKQIKSLISSTHPNFPQRVSPQLLQYTTSCFHHVLHIVENRQRDQEIVENRQKQKLWPNKIQKKLKWSNSKRFESEKKCWKKKNFFSPKKLIETAKKSVDFCDLWGDSEDHDLQRSTSGTKSAKGITLKLRMWRKHDMCASTKATKMFRGTLAFIYKTQTPHNGYHHSSNVPHAVWDIFYKLPYAVGNRQRLHKIVENRQKQKFWREKIGAHLQYWKSIPFFQRKKIFQKKLIFSKNFIEAAKNSAFLCLLGRFWGLWHSNMGLLKKICSVRPSETLQVNKASYLCVK